MKLLDWERHKLSKEAGSLYDEKIEDLRKIRRLADNQINRWKKAKQRRLEWLGSIKYEVGK
jgi:ribosome recycling factor